MRRIKLIVAIVCAIHCVQAGAFVVEVATDVRKTASATAPAVAPVHVVAFGDSITAGGTLPKVQRDQVWPLVVERESAGKFRLINEGKGGRPTASVPEFEQMLARHARVDVLVIALGTNDSRDITANCVPKALGNVRQMVEHARRKYGQALRVLLVGPPNLNKSALVATKPIANEREAKLRELGDGFASLAKELGCEFVSLFGSLPEKTMSKDGVHPDGEGNATIARVLGSKLKAMQP